MAFLVKDVCCLSSHSHVFPIASFLNVQCKSSSQLQITAIFTHTISENILVLNKTYLIAHSEAACYAIKFHKEKD